MDIERIQLDFNKRKYDALEQSIGNLSQGSVIAELEKYLDFLYEKNVPDSVKKEIETNNRQEHLAYRALVAPGKQFSVITLKRENEEITFSSEGLLWQRRTGSQRTATPTASHFSDFFVQYSYVQRFLNRNCLERLSNNSLNWRNAEPTAIIKLKQSICQSLNSVRKIIQ